MAKIPVPNISAEPVTWPVDRLKAYERNARKHSAKQIEQLRGSFRKFGQVWPILVREDGTIISGHGRLEAAKAEGLTEVRVIVAAGWSDEYCRAFGILDNKVALNSEWDARLLGQELQELTGLGVPAGDLGFDPKEYRALTPAGEQQGNTDPNDAPEPAPTVVSARGDLWILGRHRLLCGNSTLKADVERVLAGAKPRLMVTDPPYGVKYDPKWREQAGLTGGDTATGVVKNDDQADWREAWSLFPGAVAYVWHGGLHAGVVERSLQACRFSIRAQIIWVKQRAVISRGAYHWQHEPGWYAVREGEEDLWRFVPEHEVAAYAVADGEKADWEGGRRQSTVWNIEHVKSGTGHGTQKPVECMKRPMLNNSAPGDAVYEPFSGSGTSIIAAEMIERSCHALEIDPAYVDVAVRRWQDFTGKAAVLEGDSRAFEAIAAERLAAAAA